MTAETTYDEWGLVDAIRRTEPVVTSVRPQGPDVIDSIGEWDQPPWEQVREEAEKRYERRKELPFNHRDWVHPASAYGGVQYTGTNGSWPGGRNDPEAGVDYQGFAFIIAFFLFF